jgi:soluble lytic murein transglycosylase-like protein
MGLFVFKLTYMGKYTSLEISVPDVRKTFQNYGDAAIKKQNIALIQEINSKYGNLCEKWGDIFEIDKGVLIAFIATESAGKSNITSFVGCCYGLMQVSPESVLEVANKYKRGTGVDLPEQVRALIAQVPNVLGATKLSSTARTAVIKKLFDPNYNIAVGTMILRWLLERFSTFITGAQLNKAIIGYNAGAYYKSINSSGKPVKTIVDTASYVIMPTVPSESKKYLVKMLGVHGFLELIYKDKVI